MDTPRAWDDYFGAPAGAAAAAARVVQPGVEAANAAQLSAEDEMLTITAMEAIWAAGGRIAGPNGQPAMTADGRDVDFTPADLAGIKNLTTASQDSGIVLTKDDEAKKTDAGLATLAFGQGRTLFMRNWPVARAALADKIPFTISAPPTASVLGGQNLAVSAHSDKPRAAQALIQFLTNPSSEQILSEVGSFVPTRQFAFNNSRRPEAAQIQTALNNARPRVKTRHYTEFSREFRLGIARALNNGGKIEDDLPRRLGDIINRP